ncbi:MAG: threonylcarbamoyl-AMP synthase [Ruminococcaceae bacterium]|nr:threonylcarbamoyl-AMP synthase [Oscillospiraceae bacterium]
MQADKKMKTERLRGDGIARAAEILALGGLVAVPTETVYGLAANGLDADAVQKLYDVKDRPEVKPLSLMVADSGAMERYCRCVPRAAKVLAEKFWPGPLTIILKSRDTVPEIVRAGGETVGLRCPDHEMTLALLRRAALPLAAPSANPSGAPSPKSAQDVLTYFDGKIEAVLDGGVCGLGVESTIVDLSAPPYRILRQGALSAESVFEALAESLDVIGITGGSGCGKSTATRVLREMGALVLDCDEIYHTLTRTDDALREALTARFGDVYEGTVLNRKKLGAVVFSDPAALADLNAITHSRVGAELTRLLAEHAASGGTLAVIDAIGLLDIPHARRTLCNIAVTAPEEARIQRLLLREGITPEYARARIAAQHSDEYFATHCDHVLSNDGTLDEFEAKCRNLFTEVLNHG